MKILPLILIPLLLTACEKGSIAEQWANPDKTFSKLGQPDVPTVQSTLEKQAETAIQKGDFARASAFYEQMIDSKAPPAKDKLRYRAMMGDMLRRTGQYEKALKAFDTVLKADANNIDALEGKGLSEMALGRSADAGRTLSKVLDKDGKRWRTLNALGILFVTKNMIPEAVEYFTEGLRVSADNPAILNNVGLARAIDRNYPRAIETLQQAAKMSANDERKKQIELNLALVYGISGDLDSARAMAEKHLTGATLDNNLGLYAHLAKNDELAKTYLNMALSNSPTYYERAWNNLDIITEQSNPDTKANPYGKPKSVPIR
ncbi:MAG: tetratricopeptide repeat protein [Rickettsiales bacterium]